MKLLKRYILTAFMRTFSLSLAAFVGIYLLVDFFEKLDDFIEHEANFSLYILYFSNKIPLIISQVTPLAVLMGVFMALGGLSRNNELTAMRSCGISLWRITSPLIATSLVIVFSVLAVNEYLVPLSAKKANYIMQIQIKGKPALELKRDHLWFREGDSIINIRLATPEKQTLQGISIFKLGDNLEMLSRIDAKQAVYSEGVWLFENMVQRDFDRQSGDITHLKRMAKGNMTLAKTPEDFKTTKQKNEEFSFQDLKKMSQQLQEEGYNPIRFRVDMHSRLALPFASFVMAFLGIPFALQKGRGTSLALGVAISIAIGITYQILQATMLAFGYSAVLPPWLAAWSANLLFGLLGIWLLLSARQ